MSFLRHFLTKMSSESAAVQRLSARASAAEQLISVLRRQIEEIKKVAQPVDYEAEVERLKSENAKLAGDINVWKAKLVSAENANGAVQVGNAGEEKTVGLFRSSCGLKSIFFFN